MGNRVHRTDAFYVETDPTTLAQKINARPITVVVAGVAAATVLAALPEKVASIASILAYVTATGAPAAKVLLSLTTDYTVSATGDVTCVTTQAANTLVVTYIPLA